MRSFLSLLPWFLPGLVVSFVIGLVGARPVARFLAISMPLAFALVVSLGAAISATVPPDRSGLFPGGSASPTCDTSRIWPASPSTYLRIDDPGLNIVLFVPLGAAIGLLPRSRRSRWVVLGALTLPFVIESTQAVAPVLGRGCESADVVDNVLGLLFGYVAARAVLFATKRPG